MRKIALLIAILLLHIHSQAQSKLDTSITKTFLKCDEIMDQIKDGKYDEGMQLLKPMTIINSDQIDTLGEKMTFQLPYFMYRYGKVTGVDLVDTKTIKDFLFQRTYILRFGSYYARFVFILYRTDKGWTVTNFKYDDEINSLFK